MRFKLIILALATAFTGCMARAAQAAPPDWFGIWEAEGIVIGASGTVETPLSEVRQTFGAPSPPFTPEAKAQFEAAKAARPPRSRALCEFGFPMVMLESPLVFEVLNTPEETAMIFSQREIRHIYTDGRAQPPPEELFPTHWGSSVGHWEGRTLVVDTVATDRGTIYIWAGSQSEMIAFPSGQAHYSERIRMIDKDTLEDQMTIDDPTQFSRPWVMTHRYRRARGINRMVHEECEGNERNPAVNGQFTLK